MKLEIKKSYNYYTKTNGYMVHKNGLSVSFHSTQQESIDLCKKMIEEYLNNATAKDLVGLLIEINVASQGE